MSIMEGLKGNGPLPADILSGCAGEDENYIRSRAQLVLTEYLVRQNAERSAVITENDFLLPSLEVPPMMD